MVNITLVPTAAGFLYLEVVLDAVSRKPNAERQSEIVGWVATGYAELVLPEPPAPEAPAPKPSGLFGRMRGR